MNCPNHHTYVESTRKVDIDRLLQPNPKLVTLVRYTLVCKKLSRLWRALNSRLLFLVRTRDTASKLLSRACNEVPYGKSNCWCELTKRDQRLLANGCAENQDGVKESSVELICLPAKDSRIMVADSAFQIG